MTAGKIEKKTFEASDDDTCVYDEKTDLVQSKADLFCDVRRTGCNGDILQVVLAPLAERRGLHRHLHRCKKACFKRKGRGRIILLGVGIFFSMLGYD